MLAAFRGLWFSAALPPVRGNGAAPQLDKGHLREPTGGGSRHGRLLSGLVDCTYRKAGLDVTILPADRTPITASTARRKIDST